MPRLICTVGLPRSGKSKWARNTGYPMVNPDSIRLALHGHRFISLAEDFVWAITEIMVKSLFLAGHDIIILDSTNVLKKHRQTWLSNNWETHYKVFDISKAECILRAGDDKEIIHVIERMSNYFEPLEDDEICAK